MGANRTLAEQVAAAWEDREKDAAFVASIDAEEERRAEVKRKTEAEAEVAALAKSRLQEFLDAGLTETEFRLQWPQIVAEHFGRKHAASDAERARLVDLQRVF